MAAQVDIRAGEVLAIVPARGGSKSLPRKNLRLIAGLPMVAHSIFHCLSAKTITRTILTTDDPEIAEAGKLAGAEVPFLRPSEYAQDHSTDFEFVHHALSWLKEHEGYEPDLVVQIRPTTPIRRIDLIDEAVLALAARPDADSLRAVVDVCFSPYKMWTIAQDGFLSPVLEIQGMSEPYNQPRQILPIAVQQDGFIDITRPRTVFNLNSITGNRILPFYLERESIDIDHENDFLSAIRLMEGG